MRGALRRLVAAGLVAGAAGPLAAQGATLRAATLDLRTVLDLVRERHPLARQAALLGQQARGELLSASGALLDPTLSLSYEQKQVKGSTAYDYLNATLKVPTPIGVDLKLGFERAAGTGINPELSTPPRGYYVAGITVPLARGVLTDQRRTTLTQARAARDLADAERVAVVNKLLLAAAKGYASWYEAARREAIAREGEVLAEQRRTLVLGRWRNGESAAIDTVEAALEVLRRRTARIEAGAAAFTEARALEGFLWGDAGEPLDLPAGVVPAAPGITAPADSARVAAWIDEAVQHHPEVLKAEAKVRQAEADRFFARQGLLPEATLDGAALANRDSTSFFFSGWPAIDDNYKLALNAKTGLLLMKERGKLASSGAKLQSADLARAMAARAIRLEAAAAANALRALDEVAALQRLAVAQAALLLDGEQRRFENGESTLFLVNQRERTLLDERVKLAGAEAKAASARATLAVALGFPATLPE